MTTVIIIFSVAALMFLFTLFAFVLSASAVAELNKEVEELSGWAGLSFMIAMIGLHSFWSV